MAGRFMIPNAGGRQRPAVDKFKSVVPKKASTAKPALELPAAWRKADAK